MFERPFAALAALLVSAPAALALTLSGPAEVVDSDLLLMDGYRVYLVGVESIESGQDCRIDGRPWDCYAPAVRALQTIVDEGVVTCEVLSGPNRLRQATALCRVNGEDIGEKLVRAGFGLTIPGETEAYETAQAEAQAAGVGLWQGLFFAPADWRAANAIFADRPAFRPVAP